MAFVEAVVIQRAWQLGDSESSRAHDQSEEARVAEQVIRMIDESAGGDAAIAGVAAELAGDLALLAAFFQNLDLLPADRGMHVDAIAVLTAAAVQRLADTLSRS